MGRLVYSMSVSLDGFVETPSRSLDWVRVDEELHSLFNDEAREMSAFLYARRLYELMVDYWPTAESDPSATPELPGHWLPSHAGIRAPRSGARARWDGYDPRRPVALGRRHGGRSNQAACPRRSPRSSSRPTTSRSR
jgi:hypothetical protein